MVHERHVRFGGRLSNPLSVVGKLDNLNFRGVVQYHQAGNSGPIRRFAVGRDCPTTADDSEPTCPRGWAVVHWMLDYLLWRVNDCG
ncbi:hypothetical protein JTE90_004385 [Oedothorax gibbosus]|uniref:Uncharacterized protein n=1 Tax=Oedothorax gibbosus TaxID=931172 RepID=A0AAV6TMF1_9ARAC|nr:hypothetical protein JTE90_004385 [Oedothorax gibbosus]